MFLFTFCHKTNLHLYQWVRLTLFCLLFVNNFPTICVCAKRERKLGRKEKSTYIETLVNHYSAIPCNVIIACSKYQPNLGCLFLKFFRLLWRPSRVRAGVINDHDIVGNTLTYDWITNWSQTEHKLITIKHDHRSQNWKSGIWIQI